MPQTRKRTRKPDGPPLGRPATYQSDDEKPVTISMRLPKALHSRLERYAKQHRQSVSELLRDGLEWRLSEGDPRGLGDGAGTSSPQEYYGNTESMPGGQDVGESAGVLQEILTTLARQGEQIHALTHALERQHTQARTIASNTVIPTGKRQRTVEPTAASAQVSEDVPGYDASKQHLGKLCPRQHDYNSSGHSLRNADNQCLACKREDKRDKRAQQRQATA